VVAAATLVPAALATDSLASPPAAADAVATVNILPQPTATAPTELIALEQKMEGLQVQTETILLAEEVGGSKGLGALFGAKKGHPATLFAAHGTTQLSPVRGRFTLYGPVSSSGKTKAVAVGENFYTYDPEIGRYDGARPWVREREKSTESSLGVNLEAPLGTNPAGATGPFARLIDDVRAAESIEALGPQTVDHQSVTEFAATVPVARLGIYSAKKLGEIVREGVTTIRLDLYISATGLPVSTRIILNIKGTELIIRSDILAINTPVAAVRPPPADKTISEARYRKIESRVLRQRLKKLARKLKHKHH
jgi:hypothetical protein